MSKSKKKKEDQPVRLKKSVIADRILLFMQKENTQAFNYKQIAHAIDANHPSNRMDIINILEDLALADILTEVSLGRYKIKGNRGTENEGYFVRRSNGKNAVVIDDEQIFVAERNSMHALNGDKVRVVVSASRRGAEPEAKVVEIIEAKEQVFIGTLRIENNYCALITDSKYLAADIIIPRGKLKGGKDGDKAIARITHWRDDEMNPRGEVVDILGKKGENTAEMHAILAEFGLPYKYPESVEKAANKIDAGITPEEIARREDFRDVTTFTIDPRDAKDFDDAISLRRLPNGHWEAGVHIADVTHYVTPGTIIDREAQNRATSVYLVDRTIPMLPERLCNLLCSLRPNEEKLAYSAIFEMNDKAEVKNSRIVKTVIKSDRRFTYEEAQAVIETGEGEYKEEILKLNELAQILRKNRMAAGAVDFDRVEVRFEIDEKGKPLSVYFKESKEANKLIEEFMLLANRTVAECIGKVPKNKKTKVFPYRIHDLPDPDKLDNLNWFVNRFGYKLRTSGSKTEVSKSINKLLSDVRGKKEQNLIEMVSLKAMQKAKYSTVNIGHYGLAFDYYTHFTSPIRRFPDMMVHRLLARYLAGGRSAQQTKYEDLCDHSSEMEQIAANAERASIKYKQVEFMSDRLGQEFDGTVSGVTEWGLYVEINENKCEGMIPLRELDDDFYDFDEKSFCLTGRRFHKKFSLGDPIRIKVARANLERKQLDFALAE